MNEFNKPCAKRAKVVSVSIFYYASFHPWIKLIKSGQQFLTVLIYSITGQNEQNLNL